MEFKSIDEIIEFAIKKEEESFEIYSSLKEKVKDRALKNIFEFLSKEEVKHKEKLLDFKKGKVILTPVSEKVPDIKISEYLKKSSLEEDIDIQDALIFAMHREKDTFRMYMTLAENVKDEKAKSILLSLAQEEAKHKLKLEIMYDDYIGPEG